MSFNSDKDPDYEFETYEQYYGDADQVIRHMDECQMCGAKLVFNHMSDYKNLIVQETARCVECGHGTRKTIHKIN